MGMFIAYVTCLFFTFLAYSYSALILYCKLGVKYVPYRPPQPSSTLRPDTPGNSSKIFQIVHFVLGENDIKRIQIVLSFESFFSVHTVHVWIFKQL